MTKQKFLPPQSLHSSEGRQMRNQIISKTYSLLCGVKCQGQQQSREWGKGVHVCGREAAFLDRVEAAL